MDLLFDIAAETLRTIAADPKHLGARIGPTLVLHTWGSALTHHPHVHGIVPGGGLALDADRWVPCKPGFFLPVRVLSRLFRRRFLEELAAAHGRGQLQCFGEFVALSDAAAFAQWLAPLRKFEWVVYAKRPFAGPEAVLAYLSRYTHRVAISNSRLLSLDERGVTFRWKDYREQGRTRHKTMTLTAEEFMRRFLLHVLPAGFHRLRHYGLLANPNRKKEHRALASCCMPQRHAAAAPATPAPITAPPAHVRVSALRRADVDHPDLGPRSAHPRAAGFIGRTMIDSSSTDRTSPTASARTMPSRTPMASFCKTLGCCHRHRLLNARCSCVLGTPPTHIAHAVPTIFASPASADLQIPIDPRLC